MGGLEVKDQPLHSSLWDEVRTPPRVVEGGLEGGGGGGDGKRCGWRYGNRDGDGDRGGGDDRDGNNEDVALEEGGGTGAGGLPGGVAGGGGYMTDSGIYPQGGKGLPQNRPIVGGMKVIDGECKYMLHSLHRLP